MDTFTVKFTVSHPLSPGQRLELEGFVDTGALFTQILADALSQIGIAPSGSRAVHDADGTRDVVPVAKAAVAIDGVETATMILCGRPRSLVLLGATTLETLGLGVDPIHKHGERDFHRGCHPERLMAARRRALPNPVFGVPMTTVHFPPKLLRALDTPAARTNASRNGLVIEACERLVHSNRGVWPPGFLEGAHLSSKDRQDLTAAGKTERSIGRARRSRRGDPFSRAGA